MGLQDTEVEALQGLDLIFVHNHPNGTDASDEDLDSAFRAGAELLIVITPQGQEFVYIRGRYGMVEVRDEEASYEVGPENPEETEELRSRSEEQAAAYLADAPEYVFLQDDPEAIAKLNVSVLNQFVNTKPSQLMGLSEEEIQMEMVSAMERIESIFGYAVRFHDSYDVGANVELDMEQVHNLGTILFHYLNFFGKDVMGSTKEQTIYVLGAEERIAANPAADSPKHEGLVVLPQSTAEGNPDLNKVYLGSEIAAGAIGHETFHEMDRRLGGRLSLPYNADKGTGIGGLEWFLNTKVTNRIFNDGRPLGFMFGMILDERRKYLHLNNESRASDSEDNAEIVPDVGAAMVLGPLDEDFFSKADENNPAHSIGFAKDSSNLKDIICGIQQYIEQAAEGASEPEDFHYDFDKCMR